jgi:hypothetical protein
MQKKKNYDEQNFKEKWDLTLNFHTLSYSNSNPSSNKTLQR